MLPPAADDVGGPSEGNTPMSRTRSATRRIVLESVAAIAASLLTLGLVTAPAGAAPTAGTSAPKASAPNSQQAPQPPQPVATRAALDPALLAGRGADLGITEQEAEAAATTGTVIGPSRAAYTLPAEASGRSAVKLSPGQYVQFTLPKAANAITVRYSIPDAATGGGITAPLKVTVNGGSARTMTLTSHYAWLYNAYPFSNDPTLTTSIEPDWWTTECGCVPGTTTSFPAPFRPNHFYDEQRLLLGRSYPAGSTIRLTAPADTQAANTVIDLLDSQLVAPPKVDLIAANVLLFGADPTGRKDSAAAIDRAIAFAKRTHLKVYIPPGTYQVNRHIIVDNVTVEGAGNWYTIIKGHEVALSTPAADGSTHTGVGFYGKSAADGGSKNVHLSGFAIEGDVARTDRHRPGQRYRRCAVRLDDRWALHPPHQGRHVVRRADEEPDHHQQPDRRRDCRRHQLPHRRDKLQGGQQLPPKHRR